MVVIACVQLPNLPIALARRDALVPADRPLMLYTVERQRAVVYAASDDAGVTVGMPLRQARVRCPQATYLLAEPEHDCQVVATLAHLLESFSPRVEQVEAVPDAALVLDLGKIILPQAIALITRLRGRIRAELGLGAAIGVASNRLVAQHAARRVGGIPTDGGAGTAVLVPPGDEAAFVAPQPIGSLLVDAEILKRLDRLGLRTVGDVAQLPIHALQAQFGGTGMRLYQLARGIDAASIPKTINAPTICRTRRFVGPLLDRDVLERVIAELATRLSAQLLDDGWAACAVTLTLAVDDGAPRILERCLAEPTSGSAILAAALLALSRVAVLESGVVAVKVTVLDLRAVVAEQLDLFAPMGGQAQRLRDVLDRLGGRFAGSLLCARLAEPDTQLPERRVRLERR
jgi:nucleotidyltransferase/DNA polymerase involved in DNA repair